MMESGNGSRLVTVLLATCMFLAGVVVTGIAGVIRGDYLGRQEATRVEEQSQQARRELETRLNKRIDDTLTSIDRRLERLEGRSP